MERLKKYIDKINSETPSNIKTLQKETAEQLERFSVFLRNKCFDTQIDDYPWMDAITATLHTDVELTIPDTNVSSLALRYGYQDDFRGGINEAFEILLNVQEKDSKGTLKRVIGFSVKNKDNNQLKFEDVRNNLNDGKGNIEEKITNPNENLFVIKQALEALKKFTSKDLKFD